MGNSGAKPEIKVKGDHDITIIQNQEAHTEQHLSQEFKINVLYVLVTVLIVIKNYSAEYKLMKQQAKKTCDQISTAYGNKGNNTSVAKF